MIDVDEIRVNYPIPSIANAAMKLRHVGDEWKGCCPFHNDRTPSFTILSHAQRFHCFGCNASGDVLDFVQQLYGLDFLGAVAMLTGNSLPAVIHRPALAEPDRDTTAEARLIGRSAGPIADTPAARYLWSRGLHLLLPASLRYARLKYGSGGDLHPCLVALVASVDNRAVGVQRTYLKDNGTKADVRTPKLSLGRIRGGAIRLAPCAAELTITGGSKTG